MKPTVKKTLSTLSFLFLLTTTILTAQAPATNTRLFFPTDTASAVFFLNTPGSQPRYYPDSSFFTIGVLNNTRIYSKFDKNGNRLWTNTFRSDSVNIVSASPAPDGSTIFLGVYILGSNATAVRMAIFKANANGSVQWARQFFVPQLAGSTSFSPNMIVNESGNTLVTLVFNAPTELKTACLVFNTAGESPKSWAYNGLLRPYLSTNRGGGFLLTLAEMAAAANTAPVLRLRIIWLKDNGDEIRASAYAPVRAPDLGVQLVRVEPTQLADSSLILLHTGTTSRLGKDGSVIWSKVRFYQATVGLTFNTQSFIINGALAISSRNKIYTTSTVPETSFGLGREIGIINEFDVETGSFQARAYNTLNTRISSFTELPTKNGFWITADTTIPRGMNVTKIIANRLMRTDAAFSAGCGALVPVNSTTVDGDIQQVVPTPSLIATSFNAENAPATLTYSATSNIVNTKGECPNSIINTQDLSPSAVKVYPNPSYGDFTIDADNAEILAIEVIDWAGRSVSKLKFSTTKAPLSINGSAGAYFLRIETDKGWVLKKVIKMD